MLLVICNGTERENETTIVCPICGDVMADDYDGKILRCENRMCRYVIYKQEV